ncbi:hypothetical protein SAMN06298226_3087 [Nitrosovibrio sp. Nv4]|nr:hypothetical protein SAMN06298226_3087 [Nitrosovibrio sp. Nv4]
MACNMREVEYPKIQSSVERDMGFVTAQPFQEESIIEWRPGAIRQPLPIHIALISLDPPSPQVFPIDSTGFSPPSQQFIFHRVAYLL